MSSCSDSVVQTCSDCVVQSTTSSKRPSFMNSELIPDRIDLDQIEVFTVQQVDELFDDILQQEIIKYQQFLTQDYMPKSNDTQILEGELLKIIQARIEVATRTGFDDLGHFSKSFLKTWHEVVKVVRRRVFLDCLTDDFFINVKEIDYLCLDAINSLLFGSYLPHVDLELCCALGDVLCEIYSNLLGYIEKRMGDLEFVKNHPVKSALLKKEILDTLRVRAFRHKNCCTHFLDMICLQTAFKISSESAYSEMFKHFEEKELKIVQIEESDIFVILSANILSDPKLAERFCLSSVNTTRAIYSEIMLIFNNCIGFQEYLECNKHEITLINRENVISKFSLRSSAETLTLTTKSIIELRQLKTEFKKIPEVSVWGGFRGLSLIDRPKTFIDYREDIYESISRICNKLVNLNLMVSQEDILALDENRLRSEMVRSISVSCNFIFEFLLEVPLQYPYVQETFETFVSPSFFWLNKYLEGFVNGEYYWSSFYLVQCLEFLNPLMALEEYQHPSYFKAGIQSFKDAFQKFVRHPPPKDVVNKHSYIVDLGRSYIAQMEGTERKMRKAPPSIRFPDQPLLESHNYWILSSFGSSKKLFYKCLDQRSRKLVIIKRIMKSKAQNRSISKGELGTLMTMQNVNIVHYMDYLEDADHWFMVMEFCEDKLTPYSDPRTQLKLTEWDIRYIGRQILNGLIYLHTNHIVHRDIKPGNILKDGRGFIKLADFGEAQIIPHADEIEKFDLNSLLGTPAYMAPECLHKAKVFSSADVWSFGCVLVYLISGRHPWSQCGSNFDILCSLGSAEESPVDVDSLECSGDCKRIIKSTLQRDPDSRPTTAQLINEKFFFDVPETII